MFTKESRFKRSWLVGLVTFALSVGVVAAIWGIGGRASGLFSRHSQETVTSQVNMYLLNGRGEVDGIVLANNDQVRFRPDFGKVVAAQVKAGDEVSVTGEAGDSTNYGRAFHAAQITVNGQTLIDTDKGKDRRGGGKDGRRHKGPHGPGRGDGDGDRDNNPGPPEDLSENAPAAGDVMKSTATISRFLVNPRGDVDGMILSDSTQVRFSPKIGTAITAARTGDDTLAVVEGAGVHNELGTVIRPTTITVGTQTFALGDEDAPRAGRRHF